MSYVRHRRERLSELHTHTYADTFNHDEYNEKSEKQMTHEKGKCRVFRGKLSIFQVRNIHSHSSPLYIEISSQILKIPSVSD